jgi:hypothetical protein
MEVSIILMGKSSINGGVSIAMFDYQRVSFRDMYCFGTTPMPQGYVSKLR